MRILSKYHVTAETLKTINIPLGDFSTKLRMDLMHQMAEGLAKRMPVKVIHRKDIFQELYELESEFYIYTPEQMEQIVEEVKQIMLGGPMDVGRISGKIIELLSSNVDEIKEVDLFPDLTAAIELADAPVVGKEEVEADPSKAEPITKPKTRELKKK